jgi:hypothetical protein
MMISGLPESLDEFPKSVAAERHQIPNWSTHLLPISDTVGTSE